MPIEKGVKFTNNDVFIDHPYESVMFRWDHLNKRTYKKFYGEKESDSLVESSNKLFNDALLYGSEITEIEYLKGKHV